MRGNSSRRRAISKPNRARPSPPSASIGFSWNAAGALTLHAVLLFGPLAGGADLAPHLRLMDQMAESPTLRSVYPPAYHALGAALGSVLSPSGAVKLLAFGSVALLLFGFRRFQVATRLPDVSAALFCWVPYGFALTWCLPKVEAAGYGLAFFGLAWLWQGRHRHVAVALALAFYVHTGAALFLGLTGGIAALVLRDRRALAALALGCVLASPLFVAHWTAGCSPAEMFLFSRGDYLRSADGWSSFPMLGRIIALAGPPALLCGLLGFRALWNRDRAVATLAGVAVVLWANELWLLPFGTRTTLNLLRGLTVLAFPIAAAGGVFLSHRPRTAQAVLVASALWAVGCAWFAVPGSCHREPVQWEQQDRIVVDRCTFRWALSAPR